jgi:hypothetical protein
MWSFSLESLQNSLKNSLNSWKSRPKFSTDSGTQEVLDLPPEPSGFTSGGGRKKTLRHRKLNKTHKRRKHH